MRCVKRLGAVVLSLLLLPACATVEVAQLRQSPPPSVQPIEVPFFAQADYQCGPASLAMVARWWGRDIHPDELTPLMYLPARRASLSAELVSQARQLGLVPLPVAPDLQSLAAAVASGTPVIVRQNLGLSWAPVWHFAVVIGVDSARREWILHSGVTEAQRLSWGLFDRTWARAGRWGLRLLPADQPWPTDVAAAPMRRLLLDLQQTAPHWALPALVQANARWPQEVVFWLARAELVEDPVPVLSAGLEAMPGHPWLQQNLDYARQRSVSDR